jgi:hypothetical protein
LVARSRTTYFRYGDRSLFDQFDRKAAIYLIRVQYPLPRFPQSIVEEWLSVRFVPGNGIPRGVLEPEIFFYKNASIAEHLRNKFFNGRSNFWRSIVSSSRLCGIHPYRVPPDLRDGRGRRNTFFLPRRHRYGALCFALMHAQFFDDTSIPFRFITEMIRNDILDRVLTLRVNGQTIPPPSRPARETLGLDQRAVFSVNRSVYSYKFPLYWLNRDELIRLFRSLYARKLITNETFHHYLGVNFDRITKTSDSSSLAKLGLLLTSRGRIRGSSLTGNELRKLIDAHVSDVPELKITSIDAWRRGIARMLKAAQVRKEKIPA